MHENYANNAKYSIDDTIIDYSDLTALDDEEIKVYNDRGWAYKLFTKEDRVLLRAKFNELDSEISHRTDNVLGDGSRIVEVNNKIVLIGGTFDEPEIYCVFAINAANETEADIYKEWFYRDSNEFKQSKEAFANNCKCYESSLGKAFVRAYIAVDFSYYKGLKTMENEQYYQAISKITDILNSSKTEQEVIQNLEKEFPSNF